MTSLTTLSTDEAPSWNPADVTSQPRWRLHVVASPDPHIAGQVIDLPVGRHVLGRAPDADGLAIADARMSRRHLALSVRSPTHLVSVEDLDSRHGVFQAGQRVASSQAGHGAVLRLGDTVVVLETDPGRFNDFAEPVPEVPGRSALAREVRGRLGQAARVPGPVLIQGATGTGKEHAVGLLHRLSGRTGALVRVNVAALPDNLFESELFGHVRGAFTGAVEARSGRIREAHGGTLALDEIGELPLPQQAKLLRALEEGQIRPVGAPRDVAIDVRFCASTNADLDRRVAAGSFRQDLLARLRMHSVALPPVDARRPDLLALADAVQPLPHAPWRQVLAADAVEWLLLRRWSDNLRELKAILLRLGPIAPDVRVPRHHLLEADPVAALPPPPQVPALTAPRPPPRKAPLVGRPDPQVLDALLRHYRGNIELVARELARDRRQVYRWLEYAGIDADRLASYRQED